MMLDLKLFATKAADFAGLEHVNAQSSIWSGSRIGRMTGNRPPYEALLGHFVQRTLGVPTGNAIRKRLTPGKENTSSFTALEGFSNVFRWRRMSTIP